jgi:hypothetical protein
MTVVGITSVFIRTAPAKTISGPKTPIARARRSAARSSSFA